MFRSLVLNFSMRSKVLYIHIFPCCLHPKVHRKILVMQHCFCYFHDGSVISFHNPILLRLIWPAQLHLNARLSTEFLEFFRGEFSAIIWPQSLDLPFNLVLDQGFILLELTEYFIFPFQEIYPSLTWEIIYKGNIVHKPAELDGMGPHESECTISSIPLDLLSLPENVFFAFFPCAHPL